MPTDGIETNRSSQVDQIVAQARLETDFGEEEKSTLQEKRKRARLERCAQRAAAEAAEAAKFDVFDATTRTCFDEIPKVKCRIFPTRDENPASLSCNRVTKDYQASFSSSSFQPISSPRLWLTAKKLAFSVKSIKSYTELVRALVSDIVDAIPGFGRDEIEVKSESESRLKNSLMPNGFVCKKSDQIPFFIIQVETPDNYSNQSKLGVIYGKMFDYLHALHVVYGVEKPYGLLTTYEEFKICWLPFPFNDVTRSLCISSKTWKATADHSTSTEALRVLASALQDGSKSSISPSISSYPSSLLSRTFKVFTPQKMDWRMVSTQLVSEFPPLEVSDFFLLEELPKGNQGQGYRVFDKDGKQAVMKFVNLSWRDDFSDSDCDLPLPQSLKSKDNSMEMEPLWSQLQRERKYWVRINNTSLPRLIIANMRPALLMPYLTPLLAEEKERFLDTNSDVYQQISAIFEACLNNGYYPYAPTWRRIGWHHHNTLTPPTIKFCGFGYVEKVRDESVVEMKEKLLSQLRDELTSFE